MSSLSFGNLLFWNALLLFSLSHLTELKADKCPHAAQKCGSMVIPYPFRIRGKEDNCGLSGFDIICKPNYSFGRSEPTPFLPLPDSLEVRILNISQNHLLVESTQFYASSCKDSENITNLKLPREGPFRISDNNTFVTVGCNTMGELGMYEHRDDIRYSGCLSYCDENPSFSNCNANGCCQTPVPSNYTQYMYSASNMRSNPTDNVTCGYAALIDSNNWASMLSESSIRNFTNGHYQMRLDWAILNDTCNSAKAKSSYQCAHKAECENKEWGYLCKCGNGYQGDGYLNGTSCEDFDECSVPNDCYDSSKGGGCRNTHGSYECFCAKGSGDGNTTGTGCSTKRLQTLYVTIGVSGTLVAVLVGGVALLLIHRRRRALLTKQKNFHRNGGDHLQRLISSQTEAMTIFSLDEIEKATNNFSQSLVLGAGAYGTVYKGTLSKGTLSKGTVVAIKKSKSIEADSKEIDQFINEIVILSQINHRNVVKLLGCCLETPVPLLVYEYISNGTLFDHLFDDKYEQHFEWEDRLRIATETAEALSYLHSAASIPIVHRDVKTSNILLDNGYTSKVADFGVSRLLPMDKTHITTVVQGTLGYLDPEYFQTVQLTEKSDVYSFGVVLAELLTGLKPVSYERMKNQNNLAIFFLSKMKTSGLLEILDSRMNMEEAKSVESMVKVANLAKECLSMEGEKRPTMKEVVQELLSILGAPRSNDVADKQEEMMAIIVDDVQPSESVQHSTAIGDLYPNRAVPQGLSVSFITDGLNRGR